RTSRTPRRRSSVRRSPRTCRRPSDERSNCVHPTPTRTPSGDDRRHGLRRRQELDAQSAARSGRRGSNRHAGAAGECAFPCEGAVEAMQHSDLSADEAEEVGAIAGAVIGLGADGEEGAEMGAVLGAAALEGGHVLDESDTLFVDDAIPPGTAAAIALVEHRWAIPLRTAIQDSGGFLLTDAWIHPSDLVEAGLLLAEELPA